MLESVRVCVFVVRARRPSFLTDSPPPEAAAGWSAFLTSFFAAAFLLSESQRKYVGDMKMEEGFDGGCLR